MDPGEGPACALDLVDQPKLSACGAAPALRLDDIVGGIDVSRHDPAGLQQRRNRPFARGDANHDAKQYGRRLRLVEPMFQLTERFPGCH